MYSYEIVPDLEKILEKLARKDKATFEQILRKINEIIHVQDIEHYKNLRAPMQRFKRVHVGNSVLIFRFDKTAKKIFFEDFDHHDNIYKK